MKDDYDFSNAERGKFYRKDSALDKLPTDIEAKERHLDNLPSEELDRLWLEEASRRAAQLDTGDVELVSSEEVDRKARALVR
jgi:hypothetical protein